MNRNLRGLTMIETLASSALLSILVLAAFGASKSAVTTTGTIASADAADEHVDNALTRMRRLLLSASRSELVAVPAGDYGVAPEPPQAGVTYDNLSFRMVTGFTNGSAVYVPPLNQNPWRFWFDADDGVLNFDDGRSTTALVGGLRGLTFGLEGRQLSVTLDKAPSGHEPASTAELRLALLVP